MATPVPPRVAARLDQQRRQQSQPPRRPTGQKPRPAPTTNPSKRTGGTR